MTSPDASRDKFHENLHALLAIVSQATSRLSLVTSTTASAQAMLPGKECSVLMVSAASRTMAYSFSAPAKNTDSF
ncbi:hypothetical protein SprV_0100286400 [Sparganum proliferum]